MFMDSLQKKELDQPTKTLLPLEIQTLPAIHADCECTLHSHSKKLTDQDLAPTKQRDTWNGHESWYVKCVYLKEGV